MNESQKFKLIQYDEDTNSVSERLNLDTDSEEMQSISVNQVEAKNLLILWRYRALKAARSHYMQAVESRRRDSWLTMSNAILSIAILFVANSAWVESLLNDLNISKFNDIETTIQFHNVVTSVFAVLLVLTTIMQYILRLGEKSAEHKSAGTEFANIQRKIERYIVHGSYTMPMIHNINRDYNHISKSYPLSSSAKWKKAGKYGGVDSIIYKLEKYET